MKKFLPSIPYVVFFCLTFAAMRVNAQNGAVAGKIIDDKSQAVSYATIQLLDTQYGATSDDDGNYRINNIPPGTYTIQATYVGYTNFTQSVTISNNEVTINITLKPDYMNLSEVVVVGYGTKQVKDLTGAITTISSDNFLDGDVPTPDKLIAGKVAGVEIISNGGAPGSGSTIRIRGGTSLNASNDPLIVIDGVPLDNNKIDGAPNPLSLINPHDIENITVLKDASASAIYGSRAANGVIIITTKKGAAGQKDLGVEFSSTNSISHLNDYVPMLNADQLRSLIDSIGTDDQKELVGTNSTNWQQEIYRTAFATDNNLSFSGGIPMLPYRLSVGYLFQQGVLKRSELDRSSVTLNVDPTFLDDHLKVDLNFKYSYTYNFFANQDAIGSAVAFDPTQPVYSDTTAYGGYWEWLDPTTGAPAALAPRNPVGLLYQKEDNGHVNRYIGNIQLDYKLHFFPDLRLNLNVGGDLTRSNGTVYIPAEAASDYTRGGVDKQYSQEKDNKLFEIYANYLKDFKSIRSKIDFTAGHSYQDWIRSNPSFPDLNVAGDTITPAGVPFKTQNTLISFYGRLNYTFMDRYLLTLTLRDDGSSRFSPDTRWGLFPSAALAWRISDENFLKNSKAISNLKLRLGYGETGQQDIFADYPYIANYSQGDPTAQYQFGSSFYYVLRPDGYDADIKWESTVTYNVGLDYGFINGRINGSIDVYKKITSDLLSVIPVPAGSNFTNYILTNVGAMENRGIEFTVDVVPYDTKDFTWDIGGNVTYNHNEITKLSKVIDTSSVGILVGNIGGGVGNTVQIQAVGHPTYSYYVYQQLYDPNGNPIEANGQDITDVDAFADLNHDGKITPDDLYISEHHPAPDVYAALSSSFRYKNWFASFQLRGSWGNYLYNNVAARLGYLTAIDGTRNFIETLSTSYYATKFVNPHYLSDFYVENASFVRCDNISLGYTFRDLTSRKIDLTLTGVVQNLFLISGYSGLDPEIQNGIDNNIYPNPTIYSIKLNVKL